MQLLPVVDILNGIVVHAVAGRRHQYRPITSRLTPYYEPIAVANAIRDTFGLSELYVADLDGILKQRPNHSVHQALLDEGFQLLLDPGIREIAELERLNPAIDLVVALETCRSPDELSQIVRQWQRVTFSVDMINGRLQRPVLDDTSSETTSPTSEQWNEVAEECVRQAVNGNVTSIIALDLADVGMATGGSTDAVCRFIRQEFPTMRLVTGGGVRGPEDLCRLKNLHVNAVLVASALHDGRICREDLLSL
jgi:phosphoribosylformimino-5-aminoimidazole carboxamide ribotide isomerase